jgi:integrase
MVSTPTKRPGDAETPRGTAQGDVTSMSKPNPNRRSYGTGRLYIKSGAYYGRWWVDGRRVNRRLGKVREPGTREGLTKREAESAMRQQIQLVTAAPTQERLSVADAGDRFVELLELKGRKPSTIEAVHSALRVHLVPQFGDRPLDRIDIRAVERFIASERREGRAPKSIRNYLGVLHSIFELGVEKGWARENPVKRAAKPEGDGNPEIRFLTLEEVEAVLVAVPDDVLGSVEGTLYLTAAMTGLRQGELLGLRWSDVDWLGGKVRVRRAYVRGEYGTTKSRRGFRAVPLADRVGAELEALSCRSMFTADDDLVFGHPQTGAPLDRSRVTKRFKAAVRAAGVRAVRFHDLRHTFGTRMAAVGVPMRTVQEWMGHADFKTTLIYADYSPDERRDRELIDRAFAGQGSNPGSNLSETESNSDASNRSVTREEA